MLTNLDFLSYGKAWPPKGEHKRLDLYKDNKLLFEGEHALVFKEIWDRLKRPEWNYDSNEILLNWPKRLSTLWADLLFGEMPTLADKDGDDGKTAKLEALASSIDLWTRCYTGAIDTSRYGNAVFKVWRREGDAKVFLSVIAPQFWFPVASPENMDDIQWHVLAWPSIPDEEDTRLRDEKSRLYVEIHGREMVYFRTYKLPAHGGTLENPIEEREEVNALNEFYVVPVAPFRASDSIYGFDDYSDVASIVQEIEVRFAQLSRVLDRHADPKMYGPPLTSHVDPETGERITDKGDYFTVPDKESVVPSYLTWNAEVESSFRQIEMLMRQFYLTSETSEAVFGEIKSGLAESGSALRRLLTVPLAKVNRVRNSFDPAIKQILKIASGLSGNIDEKINAAITWKDGLPDDEMEQTDIAVKQTAASLVSKYTARKRLFNMTDSQSAEEGQRIEEEAPSVDEPVVLDDDTDTGGGGDE